MPHRAERTVLRLSDHERMVLKLLTAALAVSEYTDEVDNIRSMRREAQMTSAMRELFIAVGGLSLAAGDVNADTREALKSSRSEDLSPLHPLLESAFEVGRRFKRLNPDKMRGDYGKMLMLLQDATEHRLKSLGLGQLAAPVQTVSGALENIGASALLTDPLLARATKTHCSSANELGEKNLAIEKLVECYGEDDVNKREVVDRCIRSISDVDEFIAINLRPITRLLKWLDELFANETGDNSLSIRAGDKGGSHLTHSHQTQRQYVKESLTLWQIIHRDIFDFWEAVEEDMIGAARYRFANTGQGFHRVCAAPKTGARMQRALAEAQQRMGGWVGITVVHLGDQDVPNALVFIDKYTVIPSLLSPIVQVIDQLEVIYDESHPEQYPGMRNLMRSKFGSFEKLRLAILRDFFRHGFDGSGDNGGSCIDGRLTSAWNWCSLLHKKKYYDAFILSGFTGFDAH